MATPSTAELLDVFKNMTVLELNDFLKAFEEEFGVTAAAPVAVADRAANVVGSGQPPPVSVVTHASSFRAKEHRDHMPSAIRGQEKRRPGPPFFFRPSFPSRSALISPFQRCPAPSSC